VLVFFGSKPGELTLLAGTRIPSNTPFDQIHTEMVKIARPNVDVVSAWHGAIPTSHTTGLNPLLITDKGVDGAINDIVGTSVPLSKVIVYGYSLGGTDALDLSRRLTVERIRLLITVDATVPFTSDDVNRRVGPSVVKNLNFFQTHKHSITGSRGGPNTGSGVFNLDRSVSYEGRESDGHILIHGDTVQTAIMEIRKEFFSL
jgi:hypothetical protein